MTDNVKTSLLSVSQNNSKSDHETLFSVQNAITAIRLGEPFLLEDNGNHHMCLGVDGINDKTFASFVNEQLGRSPLLILSSERGGALGFDKTSPISMALSSSDTASSLYSIAASHPAKISRRPIHEQVDAKPALELLAKTKHLPACLFYSNVTNAQMLINRGILVISNQSIANYDAAKVRSLRRKSEAPIPVRGGINTRMVVFEYATGENEIALVVGKPDITKELPIRIHSACATGDIFGSERCDCGDQLRLAIEKLDELGGGAVLYLDQEGRGIGLANKIRAYDLQDQSLDTVDANRTLGFADDMRDYAVAASMVRTLGWKAVSILTNNPNKVSALEKHDLDVVDRISHQAPMNEYNSHYLRTKAKRSGHMLKYK
ncbi:MAG: GTP cyclohydrolase II [Hyphomicrobiales bacterium]